MAGQIKRMLDTIIAERARGNPILIQTTKTKLTLKGLDPDKFNSASPDDPAMVEKVKTIAAELGIHI
jgi:hypothetical protein